MENYHIERRNRLDACCMANSQKISLKPKLSPSVDLAYTLGVLLGDACVCHSKRAFIVLMNVRVKKFAESFADSLTNIGLNPLVKRIWKKSTIGGKEYKRYFWLVRANSKLFVLWFKSLEVNNLKKFLEKPKYKLAFLRGIYESEGTAGYWRRGHGKSWVIRIAMTNFDVLKLCCELFKELGYTLCLTHQGRLRSGKEYYSLEKNGAAVLEILKILKPCIKGISCVG
jgi:intein-encoded DNA endonuclease-like protein